MRPRPPIPTDGDGVAVNRERFLTAEAARARRGAGHHPRLLVALARDEGGRGPDRAAVHPRPRGRHAADPQRRAGAAHPARPAGGPAGQHPAHRLPRAGAGPAHRRRRARALPRPGHARPRLLLRRGVRRDQRDRHRAGGRPADARVRARALRRAPGDAGLRRGADPPPDLRQDRRRGRPDLLAPGRRLAAADPGQVDGRADPPAAAGRRRHPRAGAVPRVPAGLPAHRRHRVRRRQRRVDDERPGPHACSTRPTRPRCSATARTRWPAAGPAGWRSSCPPARRPG